MIASEEPIVATPTARSTSGAFHRSASIRTQTCSTRSAIGYSSWSMWFVCSASSMRRRASGSIDVVTNDARFIDGRPSTRRPRWMAWKASRAGMPPSGNDSRGMPCVR